MKSIASGACAALLVLACTTPVEETLSRAEGPSVERRLRFDAPAAEWNEALPVGNGRLGAMVFGGFPEERIQLNTDTLWAGGPVPELPDGADLALEKARAFFFDGKPVEGQAIVQAMLPPRISPRSYQTLGDLRIRHLRPYEGEAGIERSLDLGTGVARTRVRHLHDRGEMILGVSGVWREVLASAPDDVLLVRLQTRCEYEPLELDIRLDRPADYTTRAEGADRLVMFGQAQHGPGTEGVKWHAELRAVADDGEVTTEGSTLRVRGARAVTLFLAASTDYDDSDPRMPATHFLAPECRETIDRAAGLSWEWLRERATSDHARFQNRVTVDVGKTDPAVTELTTPERLARLKEGGDDPDLLETYFQFGRYLLIASSRPGTLPANLQGLWSEHLEAPWNADYHLNINLQMNYWPAEVTNLAELAEPFARFVDGLRPAGREAARKLGCRGFFVGHTTDAWRWSAVFGEASWGMWPFGGAWASGRLMEHYRFTRDKRYLRESAYPVMAESARFLLDWLVENPRNGELISGPTTSPENTYWFPEGGELHRLSLAMGNAMDQEIAWQSFRDVLEAALVLGIDDRFTRRVRDAFDRLALPRVATDGRLLEWGMPYSEAEPGHRHMSHLYGVHPSDQFTRSSAPELFAAARRSLDFRLENGGGHTGWSRAWIVNFLARFGDGEAALTNLRALLERSTLPNLFDYHPPFQIDGNFGGTAGMAEMLIQSHEHDVHLLPALPAAWGKGSVTGLRARGAFEVDFAWEDGALVEARVLSEKGGPLTLRCGELVRQYDTRPGDVVLLRP